MAQVDIIIPVYETPIKFLKKTIQSVINQSITDWEVLIVDDSSSKRYQELLKSVLKTYSDKRLNLIFNITRMGAPGARNIGIKNSSADYIAFLDSDDLWYPQKLEEQLSLFKIFNTSLVCSNMVTIDEKEIILSKKHKDPSSKYNDYTNKKRLLSLIKKNWVKTSTVMVKKRVLERIGNFDEKLKSCQDWDLWIRFAIAKEPIYCSDNNLTLYRKRSQSISTNYDLVLASRLSVLDKTIPKVNLIYNGLINETMTCALKRNTYLSSASKYYHLGDFHQAKLLVKKSFKFGIVYKGLSRYLKCILFEPFKSFIINH